MAKTEGARILIIDDDKPLRSVLKATLQADNYRVFEAVDGDSALKASVAARPDVIILDLGLPDRSGVEIAREIRSRAATPIIVLSVYDQEADKISALDAGADDYLTKPFSAPELLARLRAVMRRWIPHGKEQVFKTGQLVFDVGKRSVFFKDEPVRLTPTEYEVLKLLVLKAGKVVTHGQLFKEVWNKSEGMGRIDHLLRVTVSNLRNKIEPDPGRPSYILTEPGVGYRLSVQEP